MRREPATQRFDEAAWLAAFRAAGGHCVQQETGELSLIYEVAGRSSLEQQRCRTLVADVIDHPQHAMRARQLRNLLDFLALLPAPS